MENTVDHSDDDGRGRSTSIPQYKQKPPPNPTHQGPFRFARQKITVDGCGCYCNTCSVEQRKLQLKFIEHNNSRKLTAPTAVHWLAAGVRTRTYGFAVKKWRIMKPLIAVLISTDYSIRPSARKGSLGAELWVGWEYFVTKSTNILPISLEDSRWIWIWNSFLELFGANRNKNTKKQKKIVMNMFPVWNLIMLLETKSTLRPHNQRGRSTC